MEQSEQIKKLEEKAPETPAAPIDAVPPQVSEIPVAEQNRLRQEGRQLMENEMNERVRQLNEQVSYRANIENCSNSMCSFARRLLSGSEYFIVQFERVINNFNVFGWVLKDMHS